MRNRLIPAIISIYPFGGVNARYFAFSWPPLVPPRRFVVVDEARVRPVPFARPHFRGRECAWFFLRIAIDFLCATVAKCPMPPLFDLPVNKDWDIVVVRPVLDRATRVESILPGSSEVRDSISGIISGHCRRSLHMGRFKCATSYPSG